MNTTNHGFYKWITSTKRMDLDTIVGDLAKDIWADMRFPTAKDNGSGGTYLSQLHNYLSARSACAEAHCALDESWDFYSPQKKNRQMGPGVRFDVFKKCDYRCQICGATAADGKLEVDHIVPVSKGGTGEEDNLWVLCFECNRGKTDKDL